MSNDLDKLACDRKKCFSNQDGVCFVLSDTNFGKRECPFYKTRETYRLDREAASRRLARIGSKQKREEEE